MSHLFYFYYPAEIIENDEIIIEGEEAHHAIKVVRIKPPEKIGLINGRGKKWICEVTGYLPGGRVKAKILQAIEEKKNRFKFTLFFPWLNRDNSIETVVSIGTEIGIGEFRFYQADRSIRPIKVLNKIEKWIIQSCKVSGRSIFPEISFHKNLESAIQNFHGSLFVAFASENAKPLVSANITNHCGLIIGPEGDLTERELLISLNAGAEMVHLGSRTLRSETAGILGSSIILIKQGEYEKINSID